MTLLHKFAAASLIATAPAAALASPDHWIYDADVVLYDDFDNDGFHHFLSVRIDADSWRVSAYVFAELYLSPDGVTWNHYHSTDDFWIGGESGDDEIFVETELVSGYPRGHYDLLIELYDADFGSYSDEFGPRQSDSMALLPLEDASQDQKPTEVVIVEGDGGGGASSWLLLPALLAAGWRGRQRLRTPRSSASF
jgi:hypothetical protein